VPVKRTLRSLAFRRISIWLGLRDPRRDLSSILEEANPQAPLQEQILILAQLVHWLRGGQVQEDQTNVRMVRLRFLFRVLDRNEKYKENLGAVLDRILSESEAPTLFAQTTLTEQGGFAREIIRRAVDRILPPAPAPGELGYAVEMIFDDDNDLEWLEAMSDEDWASVASLIKVDNSVAVMSDLKESMVLLGVQAAALGFSSDIRTRFREASVERTPNSAFLNLNLAAVRFRENQAADNELRGAVRVCQGEVEGVYRRIATSGLSIALVYRLETLTGLLKRIELLNSFIAADQVATRDLVIEIVKTRLERRSVSSLLGLNFDLFARKLIDNAGETGEHYITKTAREYWQMFKGAGGGGLVTVLTTLVKFGTVALHLPLFFEGFAFALNYSLSFLAMQAFGFILATKTPSMTSAALASRLDDTNDAKKISEFGEIVAQITRSQFIAVLGNVLLCAVGSLIFDIAYFQLAGQHVLSEAYAVHTLESFHPWKSLTILYAAETGVVLWLSSFGAGWLQNWVVFRRLPETLSNHRLLNQLLGERRSHDLGELFRHNASGWGGNISIGVMMGFLPMFGKFFGLPIDVRHVTLTSGQMTFAFRALDPSQITTSLIFEMALGLTIIAVMNFGVSTACALFVAVRAKKIRATKFARIMREVRRSFWRRPLPFFIPPRQA
jgi:site-specific recombinase